MKVDNMAVPIRVCYLPLFSKPMLTRTLLFSALLFSCNHVNSTDGMTANPSLINTAGTTIAARIKVPDGYKRVAADEGSFGDYLRQLPLKPVGSKVHYFDGSIKEPDAIYMAVVDMEIGNKNLLQCADAVIRLRAEYLFKTKQYDKIQFNLTSGFEMAYTKWRDGNRLAIKGNNVQWVKSAEPSSTYATFRNYLDAVFTYAGSLSLSREMSKVHYKDMLPGDAFIHGGSPGHCETVLDVAVNGKGEKIYLLAQSYMPAQEIQVLLNNNDHNLSPWYKLNTSISKVETPQYVFHSSELMRF